ncbi:MAG: ACT domain-containing protein [Lachnospiraceae bacterium]|nr:ACT domain-containing protein [Lachnospiraceae bacterium]
MIEKIPGAFSVCKVKTLSPALLAEPFVFVGKTDEELSVVCPTDRVPADTEDREDGWVCFRIAGPLDFSLIGILAPIAAVLAENKIGIFAVSTFNTDYILTKETQAEAAEKALTGAGYRFKQ